MQVVFGAGVLLGHASLAVDVLPILIIFHPETSHILLSIILVFVNLAFYHLSCTSDPGVVSKLNVDTLLNVYKADGTLYKGDTHCRTCDHLKVPRSQHCSELV